VCPRGKGSHRGKIADHEPWREHSGGARPDGAERRPCTSTALSPRCSARSARSSFPTSIGAYLGVRLPARLARVRGTRCSSSGAASRRCRLDRAQRSGGAHCGGLSSSGVEMMNDGAAHRRPALRGARLWDGQVLLLNVGSGVGPGAALDPQDSAGLGRVRTGLTGAPG